MEENLKQRIEELGSIIHEEKYIKGYKWVNMGMGSGDGHSFRDSVCWKKVPVYGHRFTHLLSTRTNAKEELLGIKRAYNDEEVRNLVLQQLTLARVQRNKRIRKIVDPIIGLAAAALIIWGVVEGFQYKIRRGDLKTLESFRTQRAYVINQKNELLQKGEGNYDFFAKHRLNHLTDRENRLTEWIEEYEEKLRK